MHFNALGFSTFEENSFISNKKDLRWKNKERNANHNRKKKLTKKFSEKKNYLSFVWSPRLNTSSVCVRVCLRKECQKNYLYFVRRNLLPYSPNGLTQSYCERATGSNPQNSSADSFRESTNSFVPNNVNECVSAVRVASAVSSSSRKENVPSLLYHGFILSSKQRVFESFSPPVIWILFQAQKRKKDTLIQNNDQNWRLFFGLGVLF